MTDPELLSRVLGLLDPGEGEVHGLFRNRCLLLGMPREREAAARALRLYQPQRCVARTIVMLLHGLVRCGLQGCALARIPITGTAVAVTPALSGIERGTCGVLLGSPEHKVRRAIASYRNAGTWEVAKISFGATGTTVLDREAGVLLDLQPRVAGVPRLLGLHHGEDVTVLRMPYLTGRPVDPGKPAAALELLDQWITGQQPKPITGFPEWPAIESALSRDAVSRGALRQLSREVLRPVICHGDFARWNLLRREHNSLVVLDWEWGHTGGLPGIDLVHYFLQDERLVKRLSPARALQQTQLALEGPACRDYLRKTGWRGEAILPIVACLAYKQGAGHQQNREMLQAAAVCVR